MRNDDELVRKCGTWAMGLAALAGLLILSLAVAVLVVMTDGDIRQ